MSDGKRARPAEHAFDDIRTRLHGVLAGSFRRNVIAELANAPTLGGALERLRESMRAHAWRAGGRQVHLGRAIDAHDRATRAEGFHVLHDWDGVRDRVNDDIIPVDVLHYLIDRRGTEPVDATALAILIDYYFLHILSLLAVRVWDGGDADARFDDLDRLLAALQGPDGSGQRFVSDAPTLLLLATSHFELEERGYAGLLERVRGLAMRHRSRIAAGHAGSMGCHLRFGFEATYAHDTGKMRDDNEADYPWLSFAVSTVMEEYERRLRDPSSASALEPLAEAVLGGLSADPRAFLGDAPPASLARHEAEWRVLRDLLLERRDALVETFETFRPSDEAYSPLAFFYNFSHNVVKGATVDALLWSEPWEVSLNDLLTALPRDESASGRKEKLATTLMGYARRNPDRIRRRLMPVIVYDPQTGRQGFGMTLRLLRR